MMVKLCDCSVEETGMSTVWPERYNHCPMCGKKLMMMSHEEFQKLLIEEQPVE